MSNSTEPKTEIYELFSMLYNRSLVEWRIRLRLYNMGIAATLVAIFIFSMSLCILSITMTVECCKYLLCLLILIFLTITGYVLNNKQGTLINQYKQKEKDLFNKFLKQKDNRRYENQETFFSEILNQVELNYKMPLKYTRF